MKTKEQEGLKLINLNAVRTRAKPETENQKAAEIYEQNIKHALNCT